MDDLEVVKRRCNLIIAFCIGMLIGLSVPGEVWWERLF